MTCASAIKARARDLGFDLCGIAPVDDFPELAALSRWIGARYYGTMSWLPRTARIRADVRRILPAARSVIATGTVYHTGQSPPGAPLDAGAAQVSRYALGRDYHEVIGRRLDTLLSWMRAEHGQPFDARRYVDTGPVQERVYAQYAGLGWIGKHTGLINAELGSWIFLGEIICTLALEPDAPAVDQCGGCQLCIQSCPTGAILEPGLLDARVCISYLTIEKRGSMPELLRDQVGTYVYGCDICQEVCPWNSHARVSGDPEWQPQPALADAPSLTALWLRTDAQLDALRTYGPMTRVSVAGLRRNLAVAIGNAARVVPCDLLDRFGAGDPERPSLAEPAVADAIAWARTRIAALATS